MPFYEYEIIGEDGEPVGRFEVVQTMSDAPLTKHPETGQPVRRLISAPRLAGKHTDAALNRTLKDNKKLGEMGFTKYEKTDDGKYRKSAGAGPDSLSAS